MGIFGGQLANVIEWEEFRDDMIFWKWANKEIKKGSRLIIRPGQDAIFFDSGRIEGVFTEEGTYDVESQIIPFLSTLKGFKFGFNSGMRAEVLFVNTREFQVKWGTKQVVLLPSDSLPGGIPIRANGTFTFKVKDYVSLIDQVAGIKNSYLVEDVKSRITSILDQLLMKWMVKEGKDMFNLQANSSEIGRGIQEDLDAQIRTIGITITSFQVMSVTYPEEVQAMINKTASYHMVNDVNRYQQISLADGMASPNGKGGGTASDMAGMIVGMNMANQMVQNMNQSSPLSSQSPVSQAPNFCPGCGHKAEGAKFCSNCGKQLI